jgi:hypothetical protein
MREDERKGIIELRSRMMTANVSYEIDSENRRTRGRKGEKNAMGDHRFWIWTIKNCFSSLNCSSVDARKGE